MEAVGRPQDAAAFVVGIPKSTAVRPWGQITKQKRCELLSCADRDRRPTENQKSDLAHVRRNYVIRKLFDP